MTAAVVRLCDAQAGGALPYSTRNARDGWYQPPISCGAGRRPCGGDASGGGGACGGV